VDGLCEPGPGESADGKVFGVDRLVFADQPESYLVRVVEPGFPYLAVQDSYAMPGFRPVR
jgi:hypothetical protein